MWKSSLNLDKFEYARTNPYMVKLFGVLGIATTILMAFGFWRFINLDIVYIFLFGPIILIFILNKLMRFTVQLFYQKFDIDKHNKFIVDFWSKNKEPSVDIFLPWAGEDLEMHEQVVKAASRIDYKNYKVYMLDDVGSEKHRNLAEKYNAIYLSRPNKGQYKKSGNLEFGYKNSNGEFVLILDADFIPIRDILKDLIPYIASNEKIGILQTPQYFEQTDEIHKKSKIEFGGGNIVEEFYRIVMPCRDEFKAAMCVGTSAIYRKKTITLLNGTPKVHASEDLATGLLITQYGYYVKYLPLIVSMGKSPETFQGYFKQHMRWCSGNLVFARYWPKAKLNLMGRLIYATNPLHYLSEALSIIFSFQLLFLLYFHTDSLSLIHTLYFLPYIILSRLILPMTKTNKNKVGTRLAAMNNSYTYFYTYIRMLIKGVPAWQPSGVKTSGLNGDFINAFNIGTFISSLYIISFIFVIVSRFWVFGNFNTYVVLGWSFYSVFWHTLYLSLVAKYVQPFRLMEARNFFTRSFVYAKTYAMFSLLVVLVSLSIPNAAIALLDTKSPTAVAVNHIINGPPEQTNTIAIVQNEQLPTKNVLGAQAQEKKTYSFTVESGDTLLGLSKEAIERHVRSKGITITNNQLEYASDVLAQNIPYPYKQDLKPGNRIEFDEKLVSDSVSSTISTLED